MSPGDTAGSSRAHAQTHAYATVVTDGARGVAVAYAAERMELWLDRAYPPGNPLAFTVTLPSTPLALQAKAQGSKRREDGTFEVRVKLTSLRKEHRETLAQAFATPAASER